MIHNAFTRRRFLRTTGALGLVAGLHELLPLYATRAWAADVAGQQISGGLVDLAIRIQAVRIDGRKAVAKTINGSMPGPLLRFREGDTGTIRVTNELAEDTSLHWHGVLVPAPNAVLAHEPLNPFLADRQSSCANLLEDSRRSVRAFELRMAGADQRQQLRFRQAFTARTAAAFPGAVAADAHREGLAHHRQRIDFALRVDPGVLHSASLAKYAAAFLRNTHRLLQGEPELRCPSVPLLDDALPVLLLVVRSSRVLILHAEAHGVVEQDGDLARGRGERFGFANARDQWSIEGAQRGVGSTHGDRGQSKVRDHAVGHLSRMSRQHLATADLASWRQRQPRGEMLGRAPSAQVGTAFGNQPQYQVRPEAVNLRQVHPRKLVQDTGSGIAPEDLPRIFDRFYRGEKSRQVAAKSAGLGLAITKRILELHESPITVESDVGLGTRFSFALPIADGSTAPAAALLGCDVGLRRGPEPLSTAVAEPGGQRP